MFLADVFLHGVGSPRYPTGSWQSVESCISSEPGDPNGFTIRANGCCGFAHAKRGQKPEDFLCPACLGIRGVVNQRIDRERNKQSKPLSPYEPHKSVAQDPDRARCRMSDQSAKLKILREEKRRLAERAIMVEGEEFQPGAKLHFINQTLLEVEKFGNDSLQAEGFGEGTLERQIFLACVENAQKALSTGSKHACRYPPFVIRFAISLLSKVGKNAYVVLQDTFNLPSARHLRSFQGTSAHDADGVMHEALRDAQEHADRHKLTHAQRYVFVSFDGCHLKDGVYWDAHSKEIVGFASDVYNDVDLVSATRAFVQSASTPLTGAASVTQDTPAYAKTYMVFYLSFVDPNVTLKIPIARYCLSKSTAAFLIEAVPAVISAAYYYGFTVRGIVSDGAAENRAAMSLLATIPASYFLRTMVDEKIRVKDKQSRWSGFRGGVVKRVSGFGMVEVLYDTANEEGEDDVEELDLTQTEHAWVNPATYHKSKLPEHVDFEKKIAFKHPVDPDEIVFIWQDMPHVMKRVVNLLERSNPNNKHRTSLTKFDELGCAEKLCLDMIRDVWVDFGGGSISRLRFNKLTKEHFAKNPFNRMRVPLALQVISNSVANMLGEYMRLQRPGASKFGSLKSVCMKLDRIVDLMNGAGPEKNAPIINSAHDGALYEALDLLAYFADWKHDLETRQLDLEINFFNSELWQDFSGMLLSFVCTARYHLALFPEGAICQRHGQQDVVEHHFGHLRDAAGSGRSVTAFSARSGTAKATGTRLAREGGNCSATGGINFDPLPGAERRLQKSRDDKERRKQQQQQTSK